MPYKVMLFLDYAEIKGLKDRYDDKLIAIEVRQFVFEYVQIFHRFMEHA